MSCPIRLSFSSLQLSEYFPDHRVVDFFGGIFTGRYVVCTTLLDIDEILPVREPLDRLDPSHAHLDAWEYALYALALAFCLEGTWITLRIT